MNKVVFVCAAHPDDEILGCGGTIARHTGEGDAVHVLIFTKGIASRQTYAANPEALTSDVAALQAAASRANARLGVTSLTFADFADNKMDTVSRLLIAQTVETFVAKYSPDIIYSHDSGDLNIDHVRTNEAVVVACRPTPLQSLSELYFFEVPSSTHWRPNAEFTPNHFVDISDTLMAKLSALQEYSTEMRDWPHARSLQAVEHLARWRGSTMGLEAAEAFVVGRSIIKRSDRKQQ